MMPDLSSVERLLWARWHYSLGKAKATARSIGMRDPYLSYCSQGFRFLCTMNGQFCCLLSSTSLGCHLLIRLYTENGDDVVLQTSPGLLIMPTGIIVCEATAVHSLRNVGNCKQHIGHSPHIIRELFRWPLMGQSPLLREELHDVPPWTLPRESRLQDGQSQGPGSNREGMGQKHWVEPIKGWSQSKGYLHSLDFYWQLTQ